ncbi:MAG: hypothetical protein ACNS63_03770 [Candidatus Nitrospinota bacterium M3_3B_026]
MDRWTLFQILVDIALLLLVAGLLARQRKSSKADAPGPAAEPARLSGEEIAQLEALMDELARLVVRAEKVADRIEKSSTAGSSSRLKDESAEPAPKKKAATEVEDGPVLDDQRSKASALIKKGLPDEEVSRRAGVPVHEVRLIRRMGA